jgi:hypothetical protein
MVQVVLWSVDGYLVSVAVSDNLNSQSNYLAADLT